MTFSKIRANLFAFRDKGLKVCKVVPGMLYTFELSAVCSIDVYIVKELSGIKRLLWGSSCISVFSWVIPRKFFTGFKEIEFLGQKVLCPENTEELLEFWYGSDWRIPQDKKGSYSVASYQFFTNLIVFYKVYFRKICSFMFNRTYREHILLRRKKTGSYFSKTLW